MNKVIVTTADELQSLIQLSLVRALADSSQSTHTVSNELMNVLEASAFLNLSKQTLYGFTSRHEIPFFKRGKKLYFRRSELEAWVNVGKQKTNEEIFAETLGKPVK